MTKECAPTFRLDYFRSQHHDVPVNDLGLLPYWNMYPGLESTSTDETADLRSDVCCKCVALA